MGIRLENVCYTYGSDTTSEIKALNNVNLEINKGEFVAIIGHTGSGKSTLIQHFNGLERPKSGNVFYNNENIGADMKNPHRESEKNKNHISGGNYYGRL